ncbi:MAG: hypothetical protein ACRERX_19965 [Pseudomonas sp.]
MPDLSVSVANSPVVGRRFTSATIGNRKDERRNHLQFRVSGFVIDWYQLPDFHDVPITDRGDFDGAFVPTSKVFVRNVSPASVEKAMTVVTDLCWLLRLASMSAVVPYEREYAGHIRRWSVAAEFRDFRPPIDIHDGRAVETFIEQTWLRYRRYKRPRQLEAVIDYLVYAAMSQIPVEAKLILVFTALEHLKTTFARSEGIPIFKGKYRDLPRGTPPTKNSPVLSFEQLLRRMIGGVRMRAPLKDVVRLRNRLIHTGITRNRVTRNFEIYGGIVFVIHRYVFRLLGYTGPMMHHGELTTRKP